MPTTAGKKSLQNMRWLLLDGTIVLGNERV